MPNPHVSIIKVKMTFEYNTEFDTTDGFMRVALGLL